MTPLLGSSEAIHDPGPITIAMLYDMGWDPNIAPCTHRITATPASFPAAGGSGMLTISTRDGCRWHVGSDSSWLAAGYSGTGSGSVPFVVSATPSSIARQGALLVAGQQIAIAQAGLPCTFSVSRTVVTFGAAGGTAPLIVTTTPGDCVVSRSTSAPWISVAGNQAGSSTLAVTASASAGPTRTASLSIGGIPVAVRQNGHDAPTFDVNADGTGDVVAYDPVSGHRFVAVSSPVALGFTAGATATWSPGWTVLPGDFNGDGRGDLFFYDRITGRALKGLATGAETSTYTEFAWSPDWEITVVDLNGDRADDLFVYNRTTGRWFRCLSVPDGSFRYSDAGVWSPNWSIYPADFNGDGRGDLFLYNATGDANRGRWFQVLSGQDETFSYVEGDVVWSNDWTITPGDFDGDGRTDLFLYRASGDWYRVFFSATGARYETGLWSAGWTLSRGDFNADNRTDLFVYNPTSGRWYVVISEPDGTLGYYGGAVNWSAGWQVNVTDLDVDGRADLVLYNPADGRWFQAVTQSPGIFTFANGTWPAALRIFATRPQPR
ncbi:MAG TPA: FG-GAP-like repeat-containing protein [Vicinamibacterales bacterium]|nr:FG-GAP-like repeat-containing protein [Vicinamibacterales bacterium]